MFYERVSAQPGTVTRWKSDTPPVVPVRGIFIRESPRFWNTELAILRAGTGFMSGGLLRSRVLCFSSWSTSLWYAALCSILSLWLLL